MTIRAAGILLRGPGGKVLFLKRSDQGDHAGEWCFPGGKVEEGENPLEAAKREFVEETGGGDHFVESLGGGDHQIGVSPEPLLDVTSPEGVSFATFEGETDAAFEPALADGEHIEAAWADPSDPPQPMHPGASLALRRLLATELQVAEMMAAKELPSPQRIGNFSLFDLRITGTGVAYRRAKKEWVYRRPQDYLTEEFLRRCSGLPVVMEHPDELVLDSEQFNARIVGTMLLPRVEGDEVWGVAKIFDDPAVEMMRSRQLSTSPGVVLAAAGDDKRIGMSDGSSLLIEGKPGLVDHLAICVLGVWDKGGEPAGVRSDQPDKETAMAEKTEAEMKAEEEAKAKADADEKERTEKEEKAKADAATHGKLDALMGRLDSMCSRLDAIDGGGGGKAGGSEMPGEDVTEGEAEDLENEAIGALETAQEMEAKPEALAADKQHFRRMADAARRRADAAHRIVSKRKADAQARADSQARTEFEGGILAKIDEKLAAVAKTIPLAPTEEERGKFASAQARCDSVAAEFGEEAGRPLQGETLLAYRQRLASAYKKHHPQWKTADLAKLDEQTLTIAEDHIYDSARKAARDPVDVPEGRLREVQKRDRATGRITTEFRGKASDWLAGFSGVRQRLTMIDTKPGAH